MNFEINYEILEKNSKLKPDDGWGHQCWYINEILNQIKVDKDWSVLQIGSNEHNEGTSYEDIFETYELNNITKVDAVYGDGVDIELDFHDTKKIYDLGFENHFDLVICTSMLEHDTNPFKSLENISLVTKKNGIVIITAPCTQRFHGTAGVYGTYQNFLPDFFFRNLKYNNLKIVKGSMIYMLFGTQEIYRVEGVGHHEFSLKENNLTDIYEEDMDKRNIPRIKKLTSNIKRLSFYKKYPVLILAYLITIFYPKFRFILSRPLYLASDIALVSIKK